MKLGFILTKTPSEEGFRTFLKFLEIYIANEDVSIYLLGNGVYCFVEGQSKSLRLMNMLQKSKASKIYACLDDLKARGLNANKLFDYVESFDTYDKIVHDIMENMDQVFSF